MNFIILILGRILGLIVSHPGHNFLSARFSKDYIKL